MSKEQKAHDSLDRMMELATTHIMIPRAQYEALRAIWYDWLISKPAVGTGDCKCPACHLYHDAVDAGLPPSVPLGIEETR